MDGIRATCRVRRWAGLVAIFLVSVTIPAIAALSQSQQVSGTLALIVYRGECDRLDVLSAPEADGATPATSPAPPFQSHHFVLDIEGALARLATEPHAIVIESTDGTLTSVAACGNVPAGTAPGETVTGLRDPAGGALLGVAVLTEPTPGAVRIEAWLLLAAPGGDAIADATADPTSNADDDEPEGGV
jgi:hypothetical protein